MLDKTTVEFIKVKAGEETTRTEPSPLHLAKPVQHASLGQNMGAPELAAVKPIIDRIPDGTLRREVMNTFMLATKYQALNTLVAPASKLRAKHEALLGELIDVATRTDRERLGVIKRGRV